MGYISKEGLKNLDLYKYSGEDKSILVKLFFKKFWDFCCATFFPLWLAPNAITLLGFLCCVGNFALVVHYCPYIVGTPPSWVYLSTAVTIFLYQIFDNVDGRQARRTHTSSPLGELFDHGCDSLFLTFMGVPMMHVLDCGPWPAYFLMNTTLLPFFLAHWEEFHTGKLVLGVISNPTEGQILMIGLALVSFFNGAAWWSTPYREVLPVTLPLVPADWPLNNVLMAGIYSITIPLLLINVYQVLKAVAATNGSVSRSFAMLLPFATHLAAVTVWFALSPSDIYGRHPIIGIAFFGVLASYLLNRMMVDRITKVPYNIANPIVLLSVIGALNVLVAPRPVIDEDVLLWILFTVLTTAYAHFVLSIIDELCAYLKIRCLHIPYAGRKKIPGAVAAINASNNSPKSSPKSSPKTKRAAEATAEEKQQ